MGQWKRGLLQHIHRVGYSSVYVFSRNDLRTYSGNAVKVDARVASKSIIDWWSEEPLVLLRYGDRVFEV